MEGQMAISDIKAARFLNGRALQESRVRTPRPLAPAEDAGNSGEPGPFPTWAAGAPVALGDCLTFNPLAQRRPGGERSTPRVGAGLATFVLCRFL